MPGGVALRPVLIDWSTRHEHLREISRDDVLAQITALRGRQRQTTLLALRSLFRWAKTNGTVFRDPTSRIKLSRAMQPIPQPLTSDEITPTVQVASAPHLRVAVVLAAVHAARHGDIINMQLSDVDIGNRRLTIAGSTRPLDDLTSTVLSDWLDYRRRRWPNTANPHLLTSKDGALRLGPVSYAWLGLILRGLPATLERLRIDRHLDEAISGADPLHLAEVFGMSEPTALRYADAARQLLHTATTYTLRRLAHRIQALTREARELQRQITAVIDTHAPHLLHRTGVGPDSAAALLITAGDNPDRMTSEASFAALCGVSPIEASSGKTRRRRLNRGGDRRANAALYRIVLTRSRCDQRTRDYLDRRTAQGMTRREAIRCVKRYVARKIYNLIRQPKLITEFHRNGLTNIGASEPPPVFNDAFPLDWPSTLDRLAGEVTGVVVPGHGDVVDRSYVEQQAALLAAVAAAARSAYETGQPAELPLPPEFADVALARAFRQLRGDSPTESPDELRRRLNVS